MVLESECFTMPTTSSADCCSWLLTHGPEWIPASSYPPMRCSAVGAEITAGIRNIQLFVTDLDQQHIASVFPLLFPARPAAIGGLVIPARVSALKGVANRAFTHVGKKIQKRLLPRFTNLNALGAVMFIARACRVCASFNHPAPDLVKRVCRNAAITGLVSGDKFQLFETATAEALANPQTTTRPNRYSAAITAATPYGSCNAQSGWRPVKNSKKAKPLAGNIFQGI